MAHFLPKLLQSSKSANCHLRKASGTAVRCERRGAPCASPLEETVWIPSKVHEQTHNAMKETHMLKQTL